MSNEKTAISFEDWKAHRRVNKILSESANEENPDFTEIDEEISNWAAGSGKASRPETPDADIEAWAKSNKH